MVFYLDPTNILNLLLLLALCAAMRFVPVMLLWQSITDFKKRRRRVQQQINHFKNL
jgi:NhaP-type Na+/H+ or K+/H+ antiporter